MKKAQGLSMSTIVIAALALLVLVILSVVFITQMHIFNRGARECDTLGGTCLDGQSCDEGYAKAKGTCYDAEGDIDDGKVCCLRV